MTNKWFSDAGGLMVLDSLPEGVFVTDSQMRINYFSPAAVRMTGVKSQDAVGMYCRDILKVDICKAECPVKKAFDSGRDILDVEAVATTAEGEKSAILISASRLMSSSGDVAGHVHLFRDIVSIKKKGV
jgi:PAS domain S-box-containing protein